MGGREALGGRREGGGIAFPQKPQVLFRVQGLSERCLHQTDSPCTRPSCMRSSSANRTCPVGLEPVLGTPKSLSTMTSATAPKPISRYGDSPKVYVLLSNMVSPNRPPLHKTFVLAASKALQRTQHPSSSTSPSALIPHPTSNMDVPAGLPKGFHFICVLHFLRAPKPLSRSGDSPQVYALLSNMVSPNTQPLHKTVVLAALRCPALNKSLCRWHLLHSPNGQLCVEFPKSPQPPFKVRGLSAGVCFAFEHGFP